MIKISKISFIIPVILSGIFVFSCGQFNTKDDGLDSKTIEEASENSGSDSGTDNSSGGTTITSAGFVISAITGSTTEAGGTATFTVNLKSQPTANVSIALSSSDSTEGSVSPASLLFTSSNWNTAQTVTVTGIDDSTIDGNKSYLILLGIASSSDSNYSGLDPSDVSVTNTDDETAGFTISTITDNTTESGGSTFFTFKLNSQPNANVTIAVSSSDTTEGTVSPSSLVFTSSNWSTTQSVIITGVDDSLDDGNQSYTVLLGAASSSDSNYNSLNPTDISLTNVDDETAGFTISSISGVTTEYGGTSTFTIKLNSQPTADVSIAVSSSDTTEGTVSTASLTFTTTNWSTTQTVTVTGVNDSAVDGNQSYTIVLAAASSSDSNYNGLNPDNVSVTNTDDETAGITVSSISGNTTESGGTATFTLKLTSQPSANVTIAVSSSVTTEGSVSTSSITFTSSNWNTDQTITVTGIDDSIADGDITYTVVLAAANSTDSNYNGMNPSDVSIKNVDDEYRLPDTGQTGDYRTTFGEDSDYTINPPTLIDNGDGTISDNNTKLMWQQQDDNSKFNYSNAISHCNSLSYAGYADWRLPYKKELISIIDFGRSDPAIDTTKFLNAKSSTYWTSTVYFYSSSYAWNVPFKSGGFGAATQNTQLYALCVRNDQKTISYIDNSDNTITDQKTRLIWQKQDDGSKRSTHDALSYCENLTLGGSSSWRLPNITELESIVDDNKSSPSIDTSYFTSTKSEHYISSSVHIKSGSTHNSYFINFSSGGFSITDSSGYVRCVRGGQ